MSAREVGEQWIGTGNREDLIVLVLELSATVQQLRPLRTYEGQLLPTTRGRKLASGPVGLWWHLSGAAARPVRSPTVG